MQTRDGVGRHQLLINHQGQSWERESALKLVEKLPELEISPFAEAVMMQKWGKTGSPQILATTKTLPPSWCGCRTRKCCIRALWSRVSKLACWRISLPTRIIWTQFCLCYIIFVRLPTISLLLWQKETFLGNAFAFFAWEAYFASDWGKQWAGTYFTSIPYSAQSHTLWSP